MDRIAAFVGQPLPPSNHYTKRSIAAIHPITVESRRTPETPGSPGNEKMGNISAARYLRASRTLSELAIRIY